jgi:hypothetical protein
VLERKILNGESGHGLVLEKEPVVCLIMALKVHKGLTPNERALVDGTFPIKRRGENSNAGTAGRRQKGDTIWPTGPIDSLVDEKNRSLQRGRHEGVGEVVKVWHVSVRHVHVDVVRPGGIFQVLSIERLQFRVRHWQVGVTVNNGDKTIPNVSIHAVPTIVALTGAAAKDELLGVLFFILRGLPILRSWDHQAADRPGMVGGEAEVTARERSRGGSLRDQLKGHIQVSAKVQGSH